MLVNFCLPFVGCHASDGLENAEEGGFVGKAGTKEDFRNLHVGLLAHQGFSMVDAVGVDEVGKGAASGIPDAVGEVAAVDAEPVGQVRHLQLAAQVGLLLLHELDDTLHELVVDDRLWLRLWLKCR